MYIACASHPYVYMAEHPYITHSILSKKLKSAAVHFDSTGLGLVEGCNLAHSYAFYASITL